MSKAVLISIKPKWCDLIASGKKTIEVRKTRPKILTPFKCYIYCTIAGSNEFWQETLKRDLVRWNSEKWGLKKGAVIGEFVCDWCDPFAPSAKEYAELALSSLVPPRELHEYSNNRTLYGWHISDLKIYDKPRELSEFMRKPCDFAASCGACVHAMREDINGFAGVPVDCEFAVKRPPQSWCYVEEQ